MKGFLLTIIALLGLHILSFSQDIEYPESMASGTLPLVSITTEGQQPIVSKDSTLNAKMTVTIPEGYITFNGAIANSETDIDITIHGRGNATWKGLIKPYKVKLNKKLGILDLPKQKHFALLPFAGYLNYMPGFGGLEVARLFDWWVPQVEPIELAINGEYRGKYYLTESIKVDPNRLDIYKQPDLNTNPSFIPYGWLIEVDNNPDSLTSVSIVERDSFILHITHHVPEILSDPQRQWLTEEITRINDAIYRFDDSWTEYIDPVSAARYFIIRELFWDPDGYAGSMYLHRDYGDDNEPWRFGPIWDIAGGHREKYSWVHESNHHFGVHWFPALIKSPVFMENVRREFAVLYERRGDIRNIFQKMQRYLEPSHQANYDRWGYPAVPAGMSNDAFFYTSLINHNLEWMNEAINNSAINSPEVNSELQVRGNTVRLSMLATDSLPIKVYSPDGKLMESFTLAPGEQRTLDLRGIYLLVPSGRRPMKLRL